MGKAVIKVANIIEDGRLAGPQIRIAEVARTLAEVHEKKDNVQRFNDYDTKSVKKVQTPFHDDGYREYVSIKTTVIFSKYESKAFTRRLRRYSIPSLLLPLHRLSKGLTYILQYALWFPLELILIWWTLKNYAFDIVHVSGGAWQVKGIIAGKLSGCKVLWHLNDTSMPGIIRMIFRRIASWGADGFIVAGSRVRQYYVEELEVSASKPVFEIQAPVDCSHFDRQAVEPDETIGKVEGLKIISVGNINPFKGFEYFLYMAELLNQECREKLHFFIVGPHWSSQQAYSRRLEGIRREKKLDNVIFFGPSSDVRRVHRAADIYVCSSIAEASPLAVWEAMAMQKAIVATDVGDISRFVRHGENGFIVPPSDPQALAYYVEKLVNDQELRDQFGRNARAVAMKNLDIEHVARKHAEAYSRLIGRS